MTEAAESQQQQKQKQLYCGFVQQQWKQEPSSFWIKMLPPVFQRSLLSGSLPQHHVLPAPASLFKV